MRQICRVFLLLFSFFLRLQLFAQAPANDLCANATPIVFGNGGFATGTQSFSVDLTQATFDPDEYNHPLQISTSHTVKSVWYYIDLPTTRSAKFTISSATLGNNDVGATFYLDEYNYCWFNDYNADNSGLAPISTLGSVNTGNGSCLKKGKYYIQIVGNGTANGIVNFNVEVNTPNTPFDTPATAFDFGTLIVGNQSYVSFSPECLSKENLTEPCSTFNQTPDDIVTAWFTFVTSDTVTEYSVSLLDKQSNSNYKLFKGAPSGPLQFIKCEPFFSNQYTIIGCNLDLNTSYTIMLSTSSENLDGYQNEFYINSALDFITNSPSPLQIGSNNKYSFPFEKDTVIFNNDYFGCNSFLSNNHCGSVITTDTIISAEGYIMDKSHWLTFNIPNGDNYVLIESVLDNAAAFRLFKGDVSLYCSIPEFKRFSSSASFCNLLPGVYSLQVLNNYQMIAATTQITYLPAKLTSQNQPDSLKLNSYGTFNYPKRYFPCNTVTGTGQGNGGGQCQGNNPCYVIRHIYNLAISCPGGGLDTIWYREITNVCVSPNVKDTLPFDIGLPCPFEGIDYVENVPFNPNQIDRQVYRTLYISLPASLFIYNTDPASNVPFTVFSGKLDDPSQALMPISGCNLVFQTDPCILLQPGWYSIISYFTDTSSLAPVQVSVKAKGPISSIPLYDKPFKSNLYSPTNLNLGTTAYPISLNKYNTISFETFGCMNNLPLSEVLPCCPITEYNRVSYYSVDITQESAIRVYLDYDSVGLPILTKLFQGVAKIDPTILLDNSKVVSPCNYCREIDYCRVQPGSYTFAFFAGDNMAGKTLLPKITIDRVGKTSNDDLGQAYDFGIIPNTNQTVWGNPTIPNTQPYGRKASYSEFGCATNATLAEWKICKKIFDNDKFGIDSTATVNFPQPVGNNDIVNDTENCLRSLQTMWYTFTLNGVGPATIYSNFENSDNLGTINYILFELVGQDPENAAIQPFSQIASNLQKYNGLWDSISPYGLKRVNQTDELSNLTYFNKSTCGISRYFMLITIENARKAKNLARYLELGIKFDGRVKEAGDSCINAIPITLTPAQPSKAGTTYTGCHTAGEGFGEDGSYYDCVGSNGIYQSTWYKIDVSAFNSQKIDLTINPILPLGTRYRLLGGTCNSMAVITCVPGNTGLTLTCLPSNIDYYIQLPTDFGEGIDATFNVTVAVSTDQGCVNSFSTPPVLPLFSYNYFCPNSSYLFSLEAQIGLGIVYHWEFGTGNPADTLNEPNVTFLYPSVTTPTQYTVKLTAKNIFTGDTASTSQVITIYPTVNPTNLISGASEICQGASTILFGKPGFQNYVWNNIIWSQNLTISDSGSYTLIVTDVNGCHHSETHNVNFANFDLNLTQSDQICGALPIGVAEFTAANGSLADYQFDWNVGADLPLRNDLAPGTTYQINVTRLADGCLRQFEVNIEGLPTPMAAFQTTNPACSGQNNGAISLTANQPNTVFKWLDNNTFSPNRNNLAAGDYSVALANTATGCVDTLSITIGYDPPFTINETITQPTCNGSNDGAISVTSTNSGLVYTWSGGSNSQQLTNLSPGDYELTVLDPTNNCAAVFSYTLQTPSTVTPTVLSIKDTLCAGASDGEITLASNGLIYRWLDDQSTSPVRQNLSPGLYQVEVSTALGLCSQIFDFEITGLPALQISATAANVSCFGGSDGSISVQSAIPNLVYLWSDNATGNNRTNLAAGTYTVTASYADFGCSVTESITIAEPIENQFIIQSANPTCFGYANGSIQVQSLDSQYPIGLYNLHWSDDTTITTPIRNGLADGVYSVTIIRGNCQTILNVALSSPPSLVASVITSAPQCATQSIGQIEIIGTQPNLQYEWLDASISDNPRSNLTPGVYQVKITDPASGCVQTETITLTTIPAPGFSVVAKGVCPKQNNGEVEIIPNNGVNPADYNIVWSDGSTSLTRNDLQTGAYQVHISPKSGGCDTIISVYIATYPEFTTTYSALNPKCPNDENGLINLFATVQAPYQVEFIWPDGVIANGRSNLKAGLYQIISRIVGSNCTDTLNIELIAPDSFTVTAQLTQPVCIDDINGAIRLINTSEFTLLWEDGSNSPIRSGLASGDYFLTATNEKGCEQHYEYHLKSLNGLVLADFAFKPDSSVEIPIDQAIEFQNLSNEEARRYKWHFGDGNTSIAPNAFHVYQNEGEYFVKLIVWNESGQCVDSVIKRLEIKRPDYSALLVPNAFSPNGDLNNDLFDVYSSKMQLDRLTIFDRWGNVVFDAQPYRPWDGTINGRSAAEGVYIYKIEYRNESNIQDPKIGNLTLVK